MHDLATYLIALDQVPVPFIDSWLFSFASKSQNQITSHPGLAELFMSSMLVLDNSVKMEHIVRGTLIAHLFFYFLAGEQVATCWVDFWSSVYNFFSHLRPPLF